MLRPVSFVFCVIIVMIPSMLCLPIFLTISHRFPWCFSMFPLAFLQFPRMLLPFPLSVSLVSFLGFAIHSIANNLYLKGTHSTATNLCTVFHLIIYFANRYNPSLFTFDKKINKTDRKEEKWINKKLKNRTLNVSLFCTGNNNHSFNLHRPCQFGRHQWTRVYISHYKSAKHLVFE